VNFVVRTLLLAVAAISGFVALWSLAGFVAVIAYRQGQIDEQACLADAQLPGGLGTGAVAVAVTVVSVALTFLGRGTLNRKAAIWALALFLAVTVPLLATSTVIQANSEQPQKISRDACVGDDRAEGTS